MSKVLPHFFLTQLFLLALITAGCERREARWIAAKGDICDLPAMAASKGTVGAGNIAVNLITSKNSPDSILEALSSGEADAAYIDARAALAAMAKGYDGIEVLALTCRNESGKPDRLLVTGRDWATKNSASLLLGMHRASVRFLRENKQAAVSMLSEWMGLLDSAESEKALLQAGWESSLDVTELIDLLDELRHSGVISGPQADKFALKLLKLKSPFEK